jgi:uridine kinase
MRSTLLRTRRYVGEQQRYIAECTPQQKADVVIDNNDLGAPKVIKRSTG